MKEFYTAEFNHEMSVCRRYLLRAPSDKFGWLPHPKSMTLGQLVGHLVEIPGWVTAVVEQPSLDLAPEGGPQYQSPKPADSEEAVRLFDNALTSAMASLGKLPESQLLESWSLKKAGQALLTLPRGSILRSFILNHAIHHRAQLSVYFRLNDVPVPATYGPSADERQMS